MARHFDRLQKQITPKAVAPSQVAKIRLLGVDVHSLRVEELHLRLARLIRSGSHALVLHVNVHGLNLAFRTRWLREFLNSAEIVFCDGAGVMLGARILGHRIPERITYADWMWQLARFAESEGFTFYFLGAAPGVAEAAAIHLVEQFPHIKIVGVHHGHFDHTHDSAANRAIIQGINQCQPNILVLGMGMPLQERWLHENWDQLQVNVALTGGAVFDYVSGNLHRAPRWMTDHGLEWLGRLIIEPRRLWKRYIVGNPLFLYRVLKQRLGMSPFD